MISRSPYSLVKFRLPNLEEGATTTDILIRGSSFCPFLHKIAAFNFFIHYLVSAPPLSPSAFAKGKHLTKVNKIIIDMSRTEKSYKGSAPMDHYSYSLSPGLAIGKNQFFYRIIPTSPQNAAVFKSTNRSPIFHPYLKLGKLFNDGKDSTPFPYLECGAYTLCSERQI